MKINLFILTSVTLAMVGCGGNAGSYAPAAQSAAVSLSARPETTSWVFPQAARTPNLLYVANKNYVGIYTYNNGVAGSLVGELKRFSDLQGMCTDKVGDVWIAQGARHTVTEYPHGGNTAIALVKRGRGYPVGCAVNPVNGDLAVTYNHPNAPGAEYYATVDVYPHARQPGAREYTNSTGLEWAFFLAYDDTGKLYMDGYGCKVGSCYGGTPVLMVLPPGGTGFHPVSVSGAQLRNPRGLSWIKPTLLIGDYSSESTGYKLLVTQSRAKVVQTIPYTGTREFWGSSVRAEDVVVPDQTRGVVRTYSLADGSLISTLKSAIGHPFSAVVSQVQK